MHGQQNVKISYEFLGNKKYDILQTDRRSVEKSRKVQKIAYRVALVSVH